MSVSYQPAIGVTYQEDHLALLEEKKTGINPVYYPITWTQSQFSEVPCKEYVFKILTGKLWQPSKKAGLPEQGLCKAIVTIDTLYRKARTNYKCMLDKAVKADREHIKSLEKYGWTWWVGAKFYRKIRGYAPYVRQEGCCNRIKWLTDVGRLEQERLGDMERRITDAYREIMDLDQEIMNVYQEITDVYQELTDTDRVKAEPLKSIQEELKVERGRLEVEKSQLESIYRSEFKRALVRYEREVKISVESTTSTSIETASSLLPLQPSFSSINEGCLETKAISQRVKTATLFVPYGGVSFPARAPVAHKNMQFSSKGSAGPSVSHYAVQGIEILEGAVAVSEIYEYSHKEGPITWSERAAELIIPAIEVAATTVIIAGAIIGAPPLSLTAAAYVNLGVRATRSLWHLAARASAEEEPPSSDELTSSYQIEGRRLSRAVNQLRDFIQYSKGLLEIFNEKVREHEDTIASHPNNSCEWNLENIQLNCNRLEHYLGELILFINRYEELSKYFRDHWSYDGDWPHFCNKWECTTQPGEERKAGSLQFGSLTF